MDTWDKAPTVIIRVISVIMHKCNYKDDNYLPHLMNHYVKHASTILQERIEFNFDIKSALLWYRF